jgi:hypothetical protein
MVATSLAFNLVFACGNCVYYEMWKDFPAIHTWSYIFPFWLVALSTLRAFGWGIHSMVPPLPIALTLISLAVVFAPGTVGPILGFWIPICCVGCLAVSLFHSSSAARVTRYVSVAFVVALATGAIGDFSYYSQRTREEWEQIYRPAWERHRQQEPPRSAQ